MAIFRFSSHVACLHKHEHALHSLQDECIHILGHELVRLFLVGAICHLVVCMVLQIHWVLDHVSAHCSTVRGCGSWTSAVGSGILGLVNLALVLGLHHLQLADDRRLVESGLDALVIVDEGPENGGRIGLDLWVHVLLAKEGHEARQELVVLQEVHLVRSVVECGVANEEKDLRHEVAQRR